VDKYFSAAIHRDRKNAGRGMVGMTEMPEPLFCRYDAADYLKTEADVMAYLDAVMAESGDDPALVAHALDVAARARRIGKFPADGYEL